MSTLQKNVIANFAGKIWTLLLSVLLVPVYVRMLGIESYGLIGFFTALYASVSLLDFGLSATMNREMARYSVWPERSDEARDMARTLEIVYWAIGLFIGVVVYVASPWIATNWLQAETIPVDVLSPLVAMMGISIALQWPISLYSGGIMGLERQVLQNVVIVVIGTIRSLGVLLVLWLVGPTITVYFLWQVIVSAMNVGAFTLLFWRSMPAGSSPAYFQPNLLRGIWRFTLGMGATGLVTFLLSQVDKIILSKLLPLTQFGYYNLANQLNTVTRMSPSSIFFAFLPRLSGLSAKKDIPALTSLYHTGCQLVAVVALPVSFVMAAFAYEIILIWTGDQAIARMVSSIASVLIVGSALNSLMGIPYDLTIASGWASFGFYQNLISAALVMPVMLMLVSKYGGIGAAIAWLVLNIGCLLVSPSVIHRRILPGELRQWYLVDVGRPLVISFTVVLFGRLCWPTNMAPWLQIILIGGIWFLALIMCVISLPAIRKQTWRLIKRVGLNITQRRRFRDGAPEQNDSF